MQDFLDLGNSARMNLPSTLGINWRWRMKARAYDNKLAKRMKEMTKIYGRYVEEDKHL